MLNYKEDVLKIIELYDKLIKCAQDSLDWKQIRGVIGEWIDF
jgi:hypothetical protein